MNPVVDRLVLLHRMEEARRQTQRQLDAIHRQITRRMTALIPRLQPRRTAYRRGRPPDPRAFLERYRANIAAIPAERQPEIDALSCKLFRQDRAIAAFRARQAAAMPDHPLRQAA
jgi:small-conductance mechanosensitive channel